MTTAFLHCTWNRVALGGLDVGYGFGKTGELRFGYEGGYQQLKPQIGSSVVGYFDCGVWTRLRS
jgi:hypothetical protein